MATSEELDMAPPRSALQCSSPSRAQRTLWSRLRTAFFDPYRPELHYMRGPGPKWREKWDRLHPAGIPVIPIAKCLAGQRKLARKFVLEWLPSGLATFTDGALLQNVLSPYILPPTAPSINQRTEIVAPNPASVANTQPVEEARMLARPDPAGSSSAAFAQAVAPPSTSQRTEIVAPDPASVAITQPVEEAR